MNTLRTMAVLLLLFVPLIASAQELDADTYLERARAALKAGEFEDAEKAATQGLALEKTFALYCNLGVAQEKLKKIEAALASFKACERVASDSTGAKAKKAANYAARAMTEMEAELRLTKREYLITSTPTSAFFTWVRKKTGCTPHHTECGYPLARTCWSSNPPTFRKKRSWKRASRDRHIRSRSFWGAKQ